MQSLKNETIIGVACGDGQTLAVSTAGEVWAWGSYKDKEGKKWFNGPDKSNIQKQQNEPMKIEVYDRFIRKL
jgi:alpha-tubulin suppressor-like RCC1 family protein